MKVVAHNYDIENITSMNVLCCKYTIANTQKVQGEPLSSGLWKIVLPPVF